MISEKEKQVLAAMRNNSRQSAVKIANNLQIPTSTVIENIDKLNSITSKFSYLIDFSQCSYPIRIVVVMKKNHLPDLINKQEVYNLHTTNKGIISDVLFQTIKDKQDFIEQIGDSQIYDVIEELKREEFKII